MPTQNAPRHITLSPMSFKTSLVSLGLAAVLALSGCTTNTTTKATPNPQVNNQPTQFESKPFTQCPPYNPEQTICTAQYQPVCVKEKTGSTISYRTAGNACSACGSEAAIGYVEGECSDDTM